VQLPLAAVMVTLLAVRLVTGAGLLPLLVPVEAEVALTHAPTSSAAAVAGTV